MSWVLDESSAKLGDRLVLLSIANHADKYGRGAYPSVSLIAAEAGLSDRQAIRSIQNLEKMGELIVFERAIRIATRRVVNLYGLPLINGYERPEGLTPRHDKLSLAQSSLEEHDDMTNCSPPHDKSSPSRDKYDIDTTYREPSLEPSKNAAVAARPRDLVFDAIADVCGIDQSVTRTMGGLIAKAKKEIVDACRESDPPLILPESIVMEISTRAVRYMRQMSGARLTPTALAKHWSALGPRSELVQSEANRRNFARASRVASGNSYESSMREAGLLK